MFLGSLPFPLLFREVVEGLPLNKILLQLRSLQKNYLNLIM